MKLTQRHNSSLQILEIGSSSLKITERGLFKTNVKEIPFQDIFIKDIYEVKHHNRYLLGYVFVFLTLFIHFTMEPAMNPGSSWLTSIVSGIFCLIAIIVYFKNIYKFCTPTKDQGMIKIYKTRPTPKAVKDFIYELEGKVNLVAKKMPVKEDLSHFLKRD